MKMYKRGITTILVLIGITSAAMAYMGGYASSSHPTPRNNSTEQVVTLSTNLVQNKVQLDSDGKVAVALTLNGAQIAQQPENEEQPVDLVVVLDRSGSMSGQKIQDARMAILQLIERLTPEDRMALITYSNYVQTISPLINMNDTNREILSYNVHQIRSGGGTNLGGGLKEGISALGDSKSGTRQRKVILISDGLANQGITDPFALGSLAANAAEQSLGVSTIGVGYDFNEVLMTTIADHGSGNYYFLESPQALAEVFEKEFNTARNVVANGLEIRIPLQDGVKLINAGGYPITYESAWLDQTSQATTKNEIRNFAKTTQHKQRISDKRNVAIIRPGDLLSGQKRQLFLTFHVPTSHERSFTLGNINVQYLHNGNQLGITDTQKLTVQCVKDREEVIASIDSKIWSEQVVKEDYNRLKDEVATAIRKGKKDKALKTIEEFEGRNRAMNKSIGSATVSQNLESDVQSLRKSVKDTFSGAPSAVAEKKKQQAKTLQYESYKIRRDKM